MLDDICTIANNLGFQPETNREVPSEYSKKYIIKQKNGEILFNYRIYKNGNTHVRFNVELAKAMNVEVSRLLGWIRSAEDIKEEFPEELAVGAEKYFKLNSYISISDNNIKLLT